VCDACGGTNRLLHGYVYDDDFAHGVYFVEWCDGPHPDRAAFVTVGLGAFGDGTDRRDRTAFCVAWRRLARLSLSLSAASVLRGVARGAVPAARCAGTTSASAKRIASRKIGLVNRSIRYYLGHHRDRSELASDQRTVADGECAGGSVWGCR